MVKTEEEGRTDKKPRHYVVKSGDSLSKIAEALLGDAERWPEILDANKDKISDPNQIRPGQELVIPS
jgi:nucleoid-associated protein YgaU